MSQRGKSSDYWQSAKVLRPIMSFKAPNRDDHWTWHSEVSLNSRQQQRGILA